MLAVSARKLKLMRKERRAVGRWDMAASWRAVLGKGRLSHEDNRGWLFCAGAFMRTIGAFANRGVE